MLNDRAGFFNTGVDFLLGRPELSIYGTVFFVYTNGIGISAESIGNLTHFFREHSQIEAVGTGNGLGHSNHKHSPFSPVVCEGHSKAQLMPFSFIDCTDKAVHLNDCAIQFS